MNICMCARLLDVLEKPCMVSRHLPGWGCQEALYAALPVPVPVIKSTDMQVEIVWHMCDTAPVMLL